MVTITTASGASVVGVQAYRATAYNLANATLTAMPWDAETFDTDGFHDNATNNSRLTVPAGKAGRYLVGGAFNASQVSGDGSRFFVDLTKNGSSIRGGRNEVPAVTGAGYPAPNASTIVDLAVGDYVEMNYYHNHGSARALDIATSGFWAVRLGD